MKKLVMFIIFFLLIISGIVYFKYGKEILTLLDEKKVYTIEDIQTTKLDTLDEYKFFNNGIITYNNQKIVLLDYSGNVIWENEDRSFAKQVFLTNNYIFKNMGNTIQVLDRNNQKFVIAEIEGNIVNVSRENDKTYIIIKGINHKNSLYIMNGNNEIIVDDKVFEDNITGVSISDKSEGYSLITLRFEDDKIINTLYFNLLDDVELWNAAIEDEILIKSKIVNNNVVAIGTKNIYYFNLNGKLMWKNGVYSEILDYEVNKENQKIYMLYKQEGSTELMEYNFEGKVTSVNDTPDNVQKLKVYEDKVFVYNENSIYLMHGKKTDKIYEDTQSAIADFTIEGNDIRILSKDKLLKGKIK